MPCPPTGKAYKLFCGQKGYGISIMSILKEFKEFISRGSVVDMAVGVVIGGAFTNIATSLTKDILTPCIGYLTGKFDISKLALTVNENLTISYGMFLQSVINFLITAAAVFILVKAINSFRRQMELLSKKAEEPPKEEEPKLSNEEILLTEIRDLLKNK